MLEIKVGNYIGYAGLFLTVIAVALLLSINLLLGVVMAGFVVLVLVWYLRNKQKGEIYLRKLAEKLNGRLERAGLGYSRVSALRKGRLIRISVISGYNSAYGLAGLGISWLLLDSVIGVSAGIENFTCVEIEHKAKVDKPFMINERVFADKRTIVYLPDSHSTTGLPKCSVKSLIKNIDGLIEKADQLENEML